jgi:hypothetical protein
VSFTVAEGDGPAAFPIEALERVDEVTEEGVAPHLAVCEDVEAAGFLQRKRLIDGAGPRSA